MITYSLVCLFVYFPPEEPISKKSKYSMQVLDMNKKIISNHLE